MRWRDALRSGSMIACIMAGSGLPARALDVEEMQGAWVQSAVTCEEAFSGHAFRRPLNIFTPAFVVSGERLTTPSATCRIREGKPLNGRLRLTLDCANVVSEEDVTAFFGRASDGSLMRFMSDREDVGTSYKRCAQ